MGRSDALHLLPTRTTPNRATEGKGLHCFRHPYRCGTRADPHRASRWRQRGAGRSGRCRLSAGERASRALREVSARRSTSTLVARDLRGSSMSCSGALSRPRGPRRDAQHKGVVSRRAAGRNWRGVAARRRAVLQRPSTALRPRKTRAGGNNDRAVQQTRNRGRERQT